MSFQIKTKLRGIWPPVLLESGADGRVDLRAVSRVVDYLADAGVHGLYTADTASEFYALEFDEWDELATHFHRAVRRKGLPTGIGCTWTNQVGSLRRIARARELGYDHIHLSQPYWIKLNASAQRCFWQSVSDVAGDMAVIVYGGSQGQLPLNGPMLERLREHCPAIAGTKSTGFDAVATNSLFAHCPELLHFVHEQVLVFWMGMGAAGCFSNLACLAPGFILEWHRLIENGDWGRAFEIQKRVCAFYEAGGVPIRREGYTLDKAMACAGGVPGMTLAQRAPYAAVPGELYRQLKAAAGKYLFTT